MTVKGIFEDFPENSSFYGSGVVMSLATSFKHHWGYWGWGGGDSYMSFVRLRPGVQLDDVNTRIEKLAEQVRKSDDVFISLVPIRDYLRYVLMGDRSHHAFFLAACSAASI